MTKTKHPQPGRYELTQTQWERIENLLPGKAGDPGRTHRRQPRTDDKVRYRLRNRIERCFAGPKPFRRIAPPVRSLPGFPLPRINYLVGGLNVDSA